MLDENNKNNNNNNNNNNNTINIKKLSKKIDEIIKIEKDQISNHNTKNQSIKYLLNLKSDLENFKSSQQKKINLNIPIRNEFFKKNIFSQLYQLLLTCLYIDNPNIRKDCIKHLYNWYMKKMEFYNSLDRIKERTDKNPNEKIQKDFSQNKSNEIIIKDEEYEINDFKQHRSEIPGLEPPKTRLNDFILKKITPLKKYKLSETVYNNRKFDLMRFKGHVGCKNNLITLKPNYNKNNTQQPWLSNSGIGVDNKLNPIDAKKEVKSSYSYNRAKYEFNSINYEKIIQNEKNKIIQEKRYLEEFQFMMKDYGKKKAIFNEKKERRKSMQDVVNTYEELMKKNTHNDDNNNNNKSVCYDSSKTKKIFNKVQKNKIDDKTNINNKLMYTKIENKKINNNNNNNNEINNNKNLNNNKKNINNENNNNIINNSNIQISPSKSLNFQNLDSSPEISFKKSDTLFATKAHNPIFFSRIFSSKLCNINLIDNKKENYFPHFNPLSAFDNKNYETFKHKKLESKEKKNRPRTASEFALRNYKKYENDFLRLRKEMNKFEENEINDIKNISFYNNIKDKEIFNKEIKNNKKSHLFKHSQSAINIQNFNGGFNPIFDQIAQRPVLEKLGSLVKLPRPETALLKKPPPIPSEKKKVKKRRFGF